MKLRWAPVTKPGFTIVELIIVIVVIAILAAVTIVAYNGVQKHAAEKTVQSNLDNAASEMQRLALANSGAFPTSLPSTITSSPKVTLAIKNSTTLKYYATNGPLTPIQNGVLMSEICQDLLNEGYGKGVDQGGNSHDYVMGCGNWNHGSMQLTAYDTETYATPVTSTALMTYADNFTSNDAYNKAGIEGAVKGFYTELVRRQTAEGGTYPITTFWDTWANAGNGGVIYQPLPTSQSNTSSYCMEATYSGYPDLIWHVTQDAKLQSGGC